MRFRFLLLASALFLATLEVSALKQKDTGQLDIGLFDSDYVARLEKQVQSWTAFQRQRVLSILGKLALFARLYRPWMRNPNTGRREMAQYFPRPPVAFHSWIYDDCSVKFLVCIEKIYASIQNRSSIIFPVLGQITTDFTFEETIFTRSITNTMFAYDISALYLLCFLSTNRLSVMRLLPFCTYGIDRRQTRTWPTELFLDARSRANIRHKDGFGAEPIDHFLGQSDFECAEESFCPDPCCGRLTHRSAAGGNFCQRSVCLHDQYDMTETANDNATTVTPPVAAKVGVSLPPSAAAVDEASHACHVDPFFNNDLRAIMENRWNMSCACVAEKSSTTAANDSEPRSSVVIDPTRIYRFDVKMCVDVDECIISECQPDEVCVNTLGGRMCVCKLGYLRRADENNKNSSNSSACSPIRLDSGEMLQNVLAPP